VFFYARGNVERFADLEEFAREWWRPLAIGRAICIWRWVRRQP
jgi:hypothetical protein